MPSISTAPDSAARAERRAPRVVAVMPAYNAARTLGKTVRDIPPGCVHEIIVGDDASADETVAIASALGLKVLRHQRNLGYGANQKTCYAAALEAGADIVVMIHPDYQYDSRLTPYLVGFIKDGVCDVMLGSRIRTRREALAGGMPLYKYVCNRALTFIENVLLGQNLAEFHTGFRAFRREVLENVAYELNSDDFVFDQEILVQAIALRYRIGEVPVPTRYDADSSSINWRRSIVYGVSTLWTLLKYGLQRLHVVRFRQFEPARREAEAAEETRAGVGRDAAPSASDASVPGAEAGGQRDSPAMAPEPPHGRSDAAGASATGAEGHARQ